MVKSDRQVLLAAVRRGDFGAFLALADDLAESSDPADQTAYGHWKKCERQCRHSVRKHLEGRSKNGGIEWVTRNLFWCLRRISAAIPTGCWRIGPARRSSSSWRTAAKLAGPMYERTRRIVQAEPQD